MRPTNEQLKARFTIETWLTKDCPAGQEDHAPLKQWCKTAGTAVVSQFIEEMQAKGIKVTDSAAEIKEKRRELGLKLSDVLEKIRTTPESEERLLLQLAIAARNLLTARFEMDANSSKHTADYFNKKLQLLRDVHGHVKKEEVLEDTKTDISASVAMRREAAKKRREAAEAQLAEAQYAALLAEGRKSQTLQQAFANGDFIPMDNSEEGSMPSITGKRLGARS